MRALERQAAAAQGPDLVVLGIGNLILSDDGVGIHALRAIGRAPELPEGVRLIDGGTVGPALLATVSGCRGLLVLDAVDVGGAPGDIVRLDLRSGVGRPGPRTAHDLGLETLLRDLQLLGEFPPRAVLLGIQPGSVALGSVLSPSVSRGLETLVNAALEEVRRWAQAPGRRSVADNGDGTAWTEDDR